MGIRTTIGEHRSVTTSYLVQRQSYHGLDPLECKKTDSRDSRYQRQVGNSAAGQSGAGVLREPLCLGRSRLESLAADHHVAQTRAAHGSSRLSRVDASAWRRSDRRQRIVSVGGWEDRRKEFSAAIEQVLGAPTDLVRPAVEVRQFGTEQLEGYTRRHVLIRSETDDWIPAYLLVPVHLSAARVPAMICLHQTVAQGKDEPCGLRGDPELAFAVELVRRGYVCIAPDAIGFGERIPAGKSPYHDSIAFYRRHPSWSFMGKMIWDVQRIVDYLQTLPCVDGQKIGCIGHSHGAYGTLFAAAFEPRISAAVASCGFTTFRSDPTPERWSHLTALIPQIGVYLPDVASIPFDWQHVLALTAPRPVYVWYATQDTVFPRTEGLQSLLQDVQGVYRLYGADQSLAWQAFDGPHSFPRTGREAAYRWLDARLAGRPTPR